MHAFIVQLDVPYLSLIWVNNVVVIRVQLLSDLNTVHASPIRTNGVTPITL